jgi:hypothetical protein
MIKTQRLEYQIMPLISYLQFKEEILLSLAQRF